MKGSDEPAERQRNGNLTNREHDRTIKGETIMEATLFGSRLSPFVEKVARTMQLKGLAFKLVEPKSPTDFKKWNPRTQKMPVLELTTTGRKSGQPRAVMLTSPWQDGDTLAVVASAGGNDVAALLWDAIESRL